MEKILNNKYLIKIFIGFFLLLSVKILIESLSSFSIILNWFILKDLIKNFLLFILSFFIKDNDEFKKVAIIIKILCNLFLFYIILETAMSGSIM